MDSKGVIRRDWPEGISATGDHSSEIMSWGIAKKKDEIDGKGI